MAENDDKREAPVTQHSEPVVDEFGADSLPLAVWHDSHRSQTHSLNPPHATLDDHRREENVPHEEALVLGD